jgi:hypothetical protein
VAWCSAGRDTSLLFEIALVLVRLDHIANIVVNANHQALPGKKRTGSELLPSQLNEFFSFYVNLVPIVVMVTMMAVVAMPAVPVV